MATNDVYRLIQRGTFGDAIAINNVFHFVALDDVASGAQLLTDWKARVWTLAAGWRANITPVYRLTSLECMRISPSIGDANTLAVNEYGTSTFNVPVAPVVCCGVLTWRTATTTRRGRGRTYLSGMGMRTAAGAVLTTDAINWNINGITVMNSIANVIEQSFVIVLNYHFQLVLWSRADAGPTLPYGPLAWKPIIGHTAQAYIATMGSRRGGRGV